MQLAEQGRLRWELDRECAACGTASCDRGRGPAPAAVRGEILAQHGTHRLRPTASGGAVLKAFRSVLGLSIAEARDAVRDGYEGTYVEVCLLAGLVGQRSPAAGDRDPNG